MRRAWRQHATLALVAMLLAACSTTHKPTTSSSSGSTGKRGGGYYQDDGPADSTPSDLDRIPDAVPRVEPYASGSNKPYSVFGHEYVPDTSDRPFSETGIGSWYGRKFNGQHTSSGETYDMFAMTAAHPTLPIPSYARVTNPANGRSVIVRINDRGPFHPGRVIDLSYAAAYKLGYIGSGSTTVRVDRILPSDIRAGRIPNATPPQAAPLYASASAMPAPLALPAAPLAVPTPPPVAAVPLSSVEIDPPAFLNDAEPVARTAVPSTAASVAQNRYDQLPADLMPTEVALAREPGRSAASDINAGLVNTPSGDAVFLQLAAFRVKTGADDFLAHMNGELDASLAQRLRVVSSGEVYRVQLGPYTSRQDAIAAAERLRSDLGIAPMVVAPH
jgi:rare lipoprotein A